MSQITLYKTILTPDRNAVIEDFDEYLATCPITYHSDKLQYQKLGLDITIKIPMDQSKRFALGNYVKITQDNKDWFYFIMNVNWVSRKAVQLVLSIDSLNTFPGLRFNDKTDLIREHRDRWGKLREEGRYLRIIDRISEGIIPFKYRDRAPISLINSDFDMDWYLIYRTRNDMTPTDISNPIDGFLVGENTFSVPDDGTAYKYKTLTPNLLSTNITGYFALPEDNPGIHLQINGSTKGYHNEMKFTNGQEIPSSWISKNVDYKPGKMVVVRMKKEDENHATLYEEKITGFKFWTNGNKVFVRILTVGPTYSRVGQIADNGSSYFSVDSVDFWDLLKILRYSTHNENPSSTPYTEMKRIDFFKDGVRVIPIMGIDQIDRSDSRNIKIIRLPYPPKGFTKDASGLVHYDDFWIIKDGKMSIRAGCFAEDFTNKKVVSMPLDFLVSNFDCYHNNAPQIEYESKLLNSELYQAKFIYDSFDYNLPLENVLVASRWVPSNFVPTVEVDFKPTNTINSKMLFKFGWQGKGVITKQTEDYGDYLLASRNNEETTYSVDFVNYIRNGYNYDKKAQSLSLKQQMANTAIQGASAMSSFGLGMSQRLVNTAASEQINAVKHMRNVARKAKINSDYQKGKITGGSKRIHMASIKEEELLSAQEMRRDAWDNTAIPFAQGISMATSLAQSVVNRKFSQAQFNNDMDHRLAQSSSQAANVSGTDDIDLMKTYNNNRLQYVSYRPEERQEEALWNLFFYTGYKAVGQGIPATHNRYWFNFVQCEPIFDNEGDFIYEEYIEDIKERIRKGFTIYHHHPEVEAEPTKQWDFEQNWENWETALLDTSKMPKYNKPEIVWNRPEITDSTITFNFPPYIERVKNYYEAEAQYFRESTSEWIDLTLVQSTDKAVSDLPGDAHQYTRFRIRMNDIARPEFTSDWVEL